MVVGDKKFDVISYVIARGTKGILPQKIVGFFHPYIALHFVRFLKHIFVYRVSQKKRYGN